jgi:hypothetical protein
VQVAAIPGAWVDADSSVTCQFQTSISSAGTKQVTMRVTDIVPGDYDPSNNEVTRSIEVIADQRFSSLRVSAEELHDQYVYRENTTWTPSGGPSSRYSHERSSSSHWQTFDAYGYFYQTSPLNSGQITMRYASGGDVLAAMSLSVADMPDVINESYAQCRGGHFSGSFARICSQGGVTEIWMTRNAGEVTYVESVVDGIWYSNYDESSGYIVGTGFIPFRSNYTLDLRHEANGNVHYAILDVPLRLESAYDRNNLGSPDCESYDLGYGVQTDCFEAFQMIRRFSGRTEGYW